MIGTFTVKTDNDVPLTRYINDYAYENLTDGTTSGAAADVLASLFDDDTYLQSLPLIYNASATSTQISLMLSLFPNALEAINASYTLDGIALYDAYDASSNKYSVEASSSNSAVWSNNNLPFMVKFERRGTSDTDISIGFGVWPSAAITEDGHHLTMSSEHEPIRVFLGIGSNSVSVTVWRNTTYNANWLAAGGAEELPIEDTESTDPFAPGGTTGDDETDPEGGDGTFENEEVTVDPPALPSLSAIQSGFIAAYMPSFSQLQNLGDYLWSDLFSLDTFKKLFSDPMQAILGLSLVPVTPSTAGSNVVIGNINTGISMPKVVNQFVTVDCGSITLPEYWGGYLDYSPYTKVEIYLPYIGVRPLDTDEVMGRTLRVVYNVDVLSGACVCFVQCDNTIRYHYVGQCGASIPITANDWTRVVNGAVSIATALGVGVATLGAGAAAGGATAASMAGTGALVGGIASQVLASKPRVEHSGSLAGMGGLLGVQFPYIIIQRPRQAVPSGQNAFTGYPSFIRRTLGTVSGYTQVTGVHLTGLSCTDEEKKEIQAYLEAGVIL